MTDVLHAGLIAHYAAGRWRGVLIEGPSGSGKSDLALRCLSLGFRLVADDRTLIWAKDGRLWGRAPASLAHLIEARGLAILSEPARRLCEINLVAHCLTPDEDLERLPPAASRTLLDVVRPLIAVRPLEASAPEKVLRALSLLGGAP